jgi:hypothetical protein
MPAAHFNGSADPVGEVIDVATDLTVCYLATRNGLSTTASLLVNRLTREGPARLTALTAAEGISQPAMTQLIQRLERQGSWPGSAIPRTDGSRWSQSPRRVDDYSTTGRASAASD